MLTVATPRGDLDLPAGSMVPFDVLVEDDLGVADLRLQWKKEATAPWHDVRCGVRGQAGAEHVAASWDAGVLARCCPAWFVHFVVRVDVAWATPRARRA